MSYSRWSRSFVSHICQTQVVALATIAVFVIPVLLDLAISTHKRIFGYLAADTFYYLTVARNIVEHGRISFDQERLTNGFHPLWQFVLTLLLGFCKALHISEYHAIVGMVLANVTFIALGLWWLALAFANEKKRLSPLFIFTPIGVYSAIISWIWLRPNSGLDFRDRFAGGPPLYGTLWSYANGMESGLVLLCYAAIAYVCVRLRPFETDRRAAQFGFLLSLFTLSRLDHVFLALPFLGLPLLGALFSRDRAKIRRTLASTLTFGVVIGLYCGTNYFVFGSPMPVSGRLKSSFPHIQLENIDLLRKCFAQSQIVEWWILFRMAQVVIPMIAGLVLLLGVVRFGGPGERLRLAHGAAPIADFLAKSALGVILLGLYNLLFVRLMAQGHWYFPVSTLFVTLTTLYFAERLKLNRFLQRGWLRPVMTILLLLSLDMSAFFRLHRRLNYHLGYANFYFEDAPRIRAYFGKHPPKLLECDDGIVTFATRFPAMSGRGLVLDVEASRIFQATGQIVPLAFERGYDHVASLYYLNAFGLSKESSSIRVWRGISDIRVQPDQYKYSVEYIAGNFLIVRLQAKE